MSLNPLHRFFIGAYQVPNEQYTMEDSYIAEFTGNSIAKYRHKLIDGNHIEADSVNSYSLNTFGYRSAEFESTRDVIFAGCSNTFGMGVAEETIWGSMVCDALGLQYYNLGAAGVSTSKIVTNILAHIKQYGKPKYLFCLFPNFARVSVPAIDRFYVSKERRHLLKNDIELSRARISTGIVESYSKIPKMIKKPFYIEEIVGIELATMMAIQSIQVLSMYCKEAGIELAWSTWSNPEDEVLEWLSSENVLDGYVPISNSDWDYDYDNKTEKYLGDNCHLDLKNQYPDTFDIAIDGEHLGVHRHRHIAEAFLSAIEK